MRQHLRALAQATDILLTWTIREIKVRYADTRLGFAWLFLYPACWVLLFTVLFGHLITVPVSGVPYPLFAMAGLAPWFFFSNTTINSVSSLKNNAMLITKVYFPREILPLGSVLVGLVDFALYLAVLGVMMMIYRRRVAPAMVMVIPVVAALAAFTLAVGLVASRLALFRRDVQLLIPLALQFFMYCAPVFYPAEVVPERYRAIYLLNPLAALVDAFRRVLIFGLWPRWTPFFAAAGTTVFALAVAYWDFKRTEPEFADRI